MRRLSPEGRFVVQSTSPMFARRSFWCIVRTIETVGLTASPYHVYVPSFGEWGFVLGGRDRAPVPEQLPEGLRYLTASAVPLLFEFPLDMARVAVEPNQLNTQALVRYYEQEWDTINR
jgi:spermidine synthase